MLGHRAGGFLGTGLLSFAVVAALLAGPPSCGEDVLHSQSDAAVDDALLATSGDATAPSDAADGDAVRTTTFRLAHLSPDVGRIDVCYRTSPSDAFDGPLVASTLRPDASVDATTFPDGGDAGPEPAGVSFASVTSWFTVQASGTFEIAVVNAADGSCSTPRARQQVTLDATKRSTVALVGLFGADAGAGTALDLVAFTDDATPASGAARTRFIHAALGAAKAGPAPAYAVKAIDAPIELPLVARVEPKKTAAATAVEPIVDSFGYHTSKPLAFGALELDAVDAVDAGPTRWTSVPNALGMTAASTHTGFVVSDPRGDLAVLWCDDASAAPSCTVLRAQ